MKNKQVAQIFNGIAELLELKGENPFRIRAYERAARNIEELGDDICKKGVKLALSTDSHRSEDLDLMKIGISTARRAWLKAGDIINTMDTGRLLKWLDK
ncbi:MAG: PHP domain-containing protein [Candidatus Omnitrophota bacterium]